MQELETRLAERSAECLDLRLQSNKVQELETRLAAISAECHDLRLQLAQEAPAEEPEEEVPLDFFVRTRHKHMSVCLFARTYLSLCVRANLARVDKSDGRERSPPPPVC